MNIKITTLTNGLLSLWVTETPNEAETPIYMAMNRTQEQITAILPVILAEVEPEEVEIESKLQSGPPPRMPVAYSQALYTMLTVLDSWISGAKSNHEALEHRNENRGEECWRSFAPSDIRNMVNDAARDLGISEFPIPNPGVEG